MTFDEIAIRIRLLQHGDRFAEIRLSEAVARRHDDRDFPPGKSIDEYTRVAIRQAFEPLFREARTTLHGTGEFIEPLPRRGAFCLEQKLDQPLTKFQGFAISSIVMGGESAKRNSAMTPSVAWRSI